MSSFESLSASHRFKFKNRGTTKPSHDVYLYVCQVRSLRSLRIKSLSSHKKGSKCQKLRVVFATPISTQRFALGRNRLRFRQLLLHKWLIGYLIGAKNSTNRFSLIRPIA